MIELLMLSKRYGWGRLRRRIEEALGLGCTDAAAIKHLLQAKGLEHPPMGSIEIGELRCYERPLPQLDHYDALLEAIQ